MDALTIENEETPREVCGSGVLDRRMRELFRLPRLVELRWLSAAKTFSLFTASLRPIEHAVANARLSGLNSYLVINPPRHNVLDRRRICPDVVFRPAKGQCCADGDIPEHVLLPFDFDPRRAQELRQRMQSGLSLSSSVISKTPISQRWAYQIPSQSSIPATASTITDAPSYPTMMRLPSASPRSTTFGPEVRYTRGDLRQVCALSSTTDALTRQHQSESPKACSFLSFNERAGLITPEMIHAVTEDLRGQLGFRRPLIARQGPWTPSYGAISAVLFDRLPAANRDRARLNFCAQSMPPECRPCWRLPGCSRDQGGMGEVLLQAPKLWRGKMRWKEFRARLFGLTGKFS